VRFNAVQKLHDNKDEEVLVVVLAVLTQFKSYTSTKIKVQIAAHGQDRVGGEARSLTTRATVSGVHQLGQQGTLTIFFVN
jgi:hypothetical protein